VTVILRDLGLLDRVVACTKYCADVCPEVADGSRLIVHDSWTAQAEQIVAAQADLVIASVPYQLKALAEILKTGVRFLGLAPRTLDNLYTDIATLAGALGAPERADAIIGKMQSRIAEVRQRTAGSTITRVFCEEWGNPIIASEIWVRELVEAAGGEFIGTPGKPIASEEITAAKPDVVLTSWCGAGDRVPLEKIVEQRSWEQLAAVQHRRVFCITDQLLNTPAPAPLLDGLAAIAWALHPELFERPTGIRQISS
jgi:iron complex transport system substrate-binding protein